MAWREMNFDGVKVPGRTLQIRQMRRDQTRWSWKSDITSQDPFCSIGCKHLTKQWYGALYSIITHKIMVNNAGLISRNPFAGDHERNYRNVIDVNLTAVIESTRLAMNEFKKFQKTGLVINVSSMSGIFPLGVSPIYSASKAGVWLVLPIYVHACAGSSHLMKHDINSVSP